MTDWRRIFLAEVTLPKTMTLLEMADIAATLKQIPEVYHSFKPATRDLRVIIECDTDYLTHRSPLGTHEFCRGWIVRGIIAHLAEFKSIPESAWVQAEWLRPPDCRIRDAEQPPAPFELRRVDLQTGQPQ